MQIGDRVRITHPGLLGSVGAIVGKDEKWIRVRLRAGRLVKFEAAWIEVVESFDTARPVSSVERSDPIPDLSAPLQTPSSARGIGSVENGHAPQREASKPSTLPTKSAVSKDPSQGGRPWSTVYAYKSAGQMYYRFAYGHGDRRLGCIHIPGGNTSNPKAQGRSRQVQQWINDGMPPERIAAMIRGGKF